MKDPLHRLDLFECAPYRARLTRQACAARFEAANRERSAARGNAAMAAAVAVSTFRHCIGCEVGAAHARGETSAEATPAKVAPAESEESVATKKCKTCGESFEGKGRAAYCSDECRPGAVIRQRRSRGRPEESKAALARELDEVIDGPTVDLDAARELLELAGYSVRAILTPAGVMLLVRGPT